MHMWQGTRAARKRKCSPELQMHTKGSAGEKSRMIQAHHNTKILQQSKLQVTGAMLTAPTASMKLAKVLLQITNVPSHGKPGHQVYSRRMDEEGVCFGRV